MDRRRREREAWRRARLLIERALVPGATVAGRAAGMLAAVEAGLADPWLARAAATFGDDAAHEAKFLPLDDDEVPYGLGLEWARKARMEGWEFVDDPYTSRFGIYALEAGPGPGRFRDRWQAEAWVRDRASEGDKTAIVALLLVIAKRGGAERWKQFSATMTPFNPALARWLEERGVDPGDWASDGMDASLFSEAMEEFRIGPSEARFWGWRSDREQRERAAAEVARVVDGFMLRQALRRIR